MQDFLDPLTLIFIAIAVVVFLRLRNVLGRRTGNERRPYDPFSRPEKPGNQEEPAHGEPDNVIPLPHKGPAPAASYDPPPAETAMPESPDWSAHAEPGSDLDKALRAIAERDSTFTPEAFLNGARLAYEMIVAGFARGDRKALKSLLSRDVYQSFVRQIEAREAEGQTQETDIVGIEKAVIVDAALEGSEASVTVKFVCSLIQVLRDSDGDVIDGDPKTIRDVVDIWTFARNVSSRDPNWKLVATEAAN